MDKAPAGGGGLLPFDRSDLVLFWQRLRVYMLGVVILIALVLAFDGAALNLPQLTNWEDLAPLAVAGLAAGMFVHARLYVQRQKAKALLLVFVDATAIGVGLVLLGLGGNALIAPFLYTALAAAIILPVGQALWMWCYDALLVALVLVSPPFTKWLGLPQTGAGEDAAVWVATGVFGVLCLAETLVLSGAFRRFTHARQAELAGQSQRKDDFLAGVSHALRTPLTCVIGFGELIEMDWADQLPPAVGTMLGELNQQADLMAGMVDNLIVRAQDMAGALAFNFDTVDLRQVASDVIRSVAWLYPDKVTRLIAGSPVMALADPARFRQIARNLMSNAVQHGGDYVTVEASNGVGAVLTVTDNGSGPVTCGGNLLNLQPFSKTSPTFGSPTLGLGIPISVRLAELMGGTLTHQHTPGTSTFTLALPLPVSTPR